MAADQVAVIGVPTNSSGTQDGVARGPSALRRAGLIAALSRYSAVIDYGDIAVPPPTPLRSPSGIIAEPSLLGMIAEVRTTVGMALAQGQFPLVVGGDCPLLLGCLEAARNQVASLGLLFVDGHEDAYPPLQSPTGEAADMELGFILGHHLESLPPALRAPLPLLRAQDVWLLGPRDAETLQREGVASILNRVQATPDAELRAGTVACLSHTAATAIAAGGRPWWLHLDLDVLASDELPAVDYHQPGGLSWTQLSQVVGAALAVPGNLGMNVTIYNPDLDPTSEGAQQIVAFLAAAMQLRQQVNGRR